MSCTKNMQHFLKHIFVFLASFSYTRWVVFVLELTSTFLLLFTLPLGLYLLRDFASDAFIPQHSLVERETFLTTFKRWYCQNVSNILRPNITTFALNCCETVSIYYRRLVITLTFPAAQQMLQSTIPHSLPHFTLDCFLSLVVSTVACVCYPV